MVFLDFWYLVFLPFPLLAVWLLPKSWRVSALLLICLVFHWHYAGPAGMKPILILAAAVYIALRTGRMFIVVGGACLSAWLFYRHAGVRESLGFTRDLAAPLAISFFTFEFLHLLIDRAQGRLRKVPRIRDYFLFVLFFPSLASGPIKRVQEFLPQYEGLGWPGLDVAARSFARVVFGFFMKLVVASWFHSLLPLNIRYNPFGSTLLLGLYCYGYVAVDLAAYSHIAIGSARLMGITLPENVDFVVLSRSFSDFWGRWHMSVTQWFRDYVLWPVAGQSSIVWRFYLGIGLAFFLSGVWHGTSVNIVLWGAINSAGVVLESVLSRTRAWRRFRSGPAAKAIPWAQWVLFQPCLMLLSLLFLYPVNQVLVQLGKGL